MFARVGFYYLFYGLSIENAHCFTLYKSQKVLETRVYEYLLVIRSRFPGNEICVKSARCAVY